MSAHRSLSVSCYGTANGSPASRLLVLVDCPCPPRPAVIRDNTLPRHTNVRASLPHYIHSPMDCVSGRRMDPSRCSWRHGVAIRSLRIHERQRTDHPTRTIQIQLPVTVAHSRADTFSRVECNAAQPAPFPIPSKTVVRSRRAALPACSAPPRSL